MSKIEEVARAIYHGTPRNKPFDKLAPNFKRYWVKRALAAVRALREPDEGMIEPGDDALQGLGYAFVDYGDAAVGYRAMIDSILSEEEAKP